MYSVLVFDLAHYQEPEHERVIGGFATREQAETFARRRVRDSSEALRAPGQTRDELRRLWLVFGEDARVLGSGYAARDELEFFLDHPAAAEERDWSSLLP